MFFRLRRLALALALGALLAAPWPPSLFAQAKPKPLVVGMELSYPPFEMTDETGKPTGIGVDLAEALAARLGRPLEVRNYEFTGLIPALKTGQIDLVLSSMTITPERKESIDFSDPYISTGLAMLVNKKSGLRSVEELDKPGRRIVVKKGTTGFDFTRKLKQAQPLILEAEAACALEVIQGKADAFIYDRISIVQFNRKSPEATSVIPLEGVSPEEWGIGLKKNNGPLLKEVNAFLAEFKTSKGLDKLIDKYITDTAASDALRVPGK